MERRAEESRDSRGGRLELISMVAFNALVIVPILGADLAFSRIEHEWVALAVGLGVLAGAIICTTYLVDTASSAALWAARMLHRGQPVREHADGYRPRHADGYRSRHAADRGPVDAALRSR